MGAAKKSTGSKKTPAQQKRRDAPKCVPSRFDDILSSGRVRLFRDAGLTANYFANSNPGSLGSVFRRRNLKPLSPFMVTVPSIFWPSSSRVSTRLSPCTVYVPEKLLDCPPSVNFQVKRLSAFRVASMVTPGAGDDFHVPLSAWADTAFPEGVAGVGVGGVAGVLVGVLGPVLLEPWPVGPTTLGPCGTFIVPP